MAFVAAVGVAQLEIRGTNQGIPVENVWYAFKSGTWDQAELDGLTEAVSDAVVEDVIPLLPTSWIGTEVYARDLSAEESYFSSDPGITGEPGTYPGTPVPNNVTLAIARSAGLTGRSSRGRIFWQGISTNMLATDENYIAPTTAAGMVAACEAIDAAIASVAAQSVILSRYNNNAPRVTPIVYFVTDWSVRDLRLDTMRRRMK